MGESSDFTVRFEMRVKRLTVRVVREAGRRMEQAATELANEVKLTLRGQRHGIRYRMPGTKGVYLKAEQGAFVLDPRTGKRRKRRGKVAYYTASAPGEPPAVATGHLRTRVSWSLQRLDSGQDTEITAEVGPRVKYGGWLEKGTRFMAPRPYLAPTWEREGARIKAYLKRRFFQ